MLVHLLVFVFDGGSSAFGGAISFARANALVASVFTGALI